MTSPAAAPARTDRSDVLSIPVPRPSQERPFDLAELERRLEAHLLIARKIQL